jgi:hypothetical protein
MSVLSIRQALEEKLKTITPAIDTAWEQKKYTPKIGRPYQSAYLLLADPENPSMGNGMYRQRGVFQVTLTYPLGRGSKDIETRADLLRTTYYRGLTLTEDSVNVVIEKTPAISHQPNEDAYAIKIVKIEFFAEIFN